MSEWDNFDSIIDANGMWLVDSQGNKMIDAVASMWCNVWGHGKPELVNALNKQSKKLQHTSMFNLTNEPSENLASSLVKICPGMSRVFFSDNGSSAMEIAFKIALQYWANNDQHDKTMIAALENGYHGDTFGSMSVGYVPNFFDKFKEKLFPVKRFSVPHSYRFPKELTLSEYQKYCLEKIKTEFEENHSIAAFVMESGAQIAGGAIIYPDKFQSQISKMCKKHEILLVVDEIATGFGRLGSMVEYQSQNSKPDIVSFGKMLTGGYLSMAATLSTKKIYDSFLGEFDEWRHLFHGHTFTGNPLAAAVANENLKLYKKYNLISHIQKTSSVFAKYHDKLKSLKLVGDVRYRGMFMGIELVKDKQNKIPISAKRSINKIFYEQGKKNGIYLRTLGNVVLLVPPLAISTNELELLLERTIKTIKSTEKFFKT